MNTSSYITHCDKKNELSTLSVYLIYGKFTITAMKGIVEIRGVLDIFRYIAANHREKIASAYAI